LCLASALTIVCASAAAQSVIAPGAAATVRNQQGSGVITRQVPMTYQQAIPASQLTSLSGKAWILGMSYRVNPSTSNSATWPPTTATWQNYDVTLAQAAVPIPNFSPIFANNMMNPVVVRNGPLNVPAATWKNPNVPGKPNPFDTFYLDFKTPYLYQGGDLVIHITHNGNNVNSFTGLNTVSPSTTNGFGHFAVGYRATTAPQGARLCCVVRLHYGYGPVPCKGSGGRPPLLILSHRLVAPFPPPGTVNFAVTNALGGATGFILVGLTKTQLRLPNGCAVVAFPPLALLPFQLSGTGPGNGRFDLNLTFLSNTNGLVTVQAAVADPGALGGYVTTNGVFF